MGYTANLEVFFKLILNTLGELFLYYDFVPPMVSCPRSVSFWMITWAGPLSQVAAGLV